MILVCPSALTSGLAIKKGRMLLSMVSGTSLQQSATASFRIGSDMQVFVEVRMTNLQCHRNVCLAGESNKQ